MGSIPTGAQKEVESDTRRSGERCKPVNVGRAVGRRNLEPRRKVEATQRELWPPEFQGIEGGSGMNDFQNWRTEAKALPGPLAHHVRVAVSNADGSSFIPDN